MKSKAQVSTEYMLIIGFALMITIPLIYIYYSYTNSMNEEVISSQADNILREVVDAAETVYYLGSPSQTTIKAYVPNNIVSEEVEGKEAIYEVRISTGTSEIVVPSPVNLTGELPVSQGIYLITIKSVGELVEISYS